jgi:hypothetical protein
MMANAALAMAGFVATSLMAAFCPTDGYAGGDRIRRSASAHGVRALSILLETESFALVRLLVFWNSAFASSFLPIAL